MTRKPAHPAPEHRRGISVHIIPAIVLAAAFLLVMLIPGSVIWTTLGKVVAILALVEWLRRTVATEK